MGYNLKITDMQAACALAQLSKVEQFIEQRKHNFIYLKEKLKSCEEYLVLPEPTYCSDPSWFGFPLTIRAETGVKRIDVLKWLDEHKIGTRLLFAGNLIRQPYMSGKQYRVSGSLEKTDIVMDNAFCVGVYLGLNVEMLDFVASMFYSIFRK